MKELEQIKKISVSAILFILIIIIGILTLKKPTITYANDIHTSLHLLTNTSPLMAMEEYSSNADKYILLDIRNTVSYQQGHLKNALHIPFNEALDPDNLTFYKQVALENKVVAIYGKNTMQANEFFIVLQQIGIQNIKILEVGTYFENSSLIYKSTATEKLVADIPSFIKKSNERKKKRKTKPFIKKVIPKKVIPRKKKKKYESEGGC